MRPVTCMIIVALAFTGCEKTIELDLEQMPERLVIEGIVTDSPGKQFVRVSRSTGFYDQGKTNRITDAVVTIADDSGETIPFLHTANQVDSAGYYVPAAGFAGKIDRTYYLTVVVNGATYEASDKLVRVTRIDTLTYRPNVFALRDPPSDGKLYELLIFAKEPQETKDYYFIKYYRNDSLIYNNETDVYIADDYGVGENIDGIPSNIRYAIGDTGKVEMYSISRKAYLFYSDLFTILNSDGGMFSPPPANPRSNLSGGALGFFQVSAVNSRETVVRE